MSMTSAPAPSRDEPRPSVPRAAAMAAARAAPRDPSLTFAVICVMLMAVMLAGLWLGLTASLDYIGH